MTKRTRRIFSTLLAVIMIFSALSIGMFSTAAAEEAEETAEEITIYFEYSSEIWGEREAKDIIHCHLWEHEGEANAGWGSKAARCQPTDDENIFSYTFDASKGLNAVIFYIVGKEQTYNLTMTNACAEDTVYLTGETIENPEDSEKITYEARWKENKDNGPQYIENSRGIFTGEYAYDENGVPYKVEDEPTTTEPGPTDPLPEPEVKILGDANLDEDVSIADATLIQYAAAEIKTLSALQTKLADVNDDGIINVVDATLIQKWLVDIEVDYPIGKPIEEEEVEEGVFIFGENNVDINEGKGAKMEENEDGTFSYILKDMEPEVYGYKVAKVTAEETLEYNDEGVMDEKSNNTNGEIVVTETCDITITFDGEKTVATGDGVEIITEHKYRVAGVEGLTGIGWDPTADENLLTETDKEGIFEIAYEDIEEGSYMFKITRNGGWAKAWGVDGKDAIVTVEEDGSKVVITFNAETKAVTTEVFGPEDLVERYYITGEDLGIGWDNLKTAVEMEKTEEGTWTCTFEDLEPEVYAYKVLVALERKIVDSYNDEGKMDKEVNFNNAELVVTETCDVTFVFDGEKVTATGDGVSVITDHVYRVVGAEDLTGVNWGKDADENIMTETAEEGIFEKVYEGIEEGSYIFKVNRNGSWAKSWGKGNDNFDISVEEDNSTVTIKFNAETKEITVDIVAQEVPAE